MSRVFIILDIIVIKLPNELNEVHGEKKKFKNYFVNMQQIQIYTSSNKPRGGPAFVFQCRLLSSLSESSSLYPLKPTVICMLSPNRSLISSEIVRLI